MSHLQDRLDNLSPEQRAVILHKLRQQHLLRNQQNDHLPKAITPVSRAQKLPLSFAQERLWFLDQLGVKSAYNRPVLLDLRGSLDVPALKQALQEIMRRHESLRTTFAVEDGKPYQVIHAQVSIDLAVFDLRTCAPEQQMAEVQRLTRAEDIRTFDLSRDPMLRTTLFRLSPLPPDNPDKDDPQHAVDQHMLLLTFHHIATDGWSLGVFAEELATLYRAFCQGQPSPLPELPFQYADFAVWQRDYWQGEVRERHLAYWKQHLAGAPELLLLPTDRPRPAEQSFRGSATRVVFNADLTRQLRVLSQNQGATLYMTLLAAFQILMFRYSGQTDLVIGSVAANRTRKELEPLIGLFVNTLALRATLSGANGKPPSFSEVLAQTQASLHAAYEHQDMPFAQLVDELQPARNLSYAPLFQVVLVMQNTPTVAFEMPGVTAQLADEDRQTARVDLELHMQEVKNHLESSCIYSTDLFDQSTIERMLGHFQRLLSSIVADPRRSIVEFPMLTALERQQLLVEWNNTAVAYPADLCFHHLFEEHVTRTPHAVALMFEAEQVTYAELNTRANQLAHYLQSLGVGPETLVGMCVERSIAMVVGLLGILKAGGAYVPLDPTYPPERLAFMLADAAPPVLLTQTRLRDALSTPNAHVVCLDSDWPTIATYPDDNPVSAVQAGNLAYVIYTSGSTGQPKGVLLEHAGLANLTRAQIRMFDLQPGNRLLQYVSPNFDVSISDLAMTLGSGATLVLAPHDRLHAAENLAHLIQNQGITHIELTPSLLATLQPDTVPGLQTLIVGGEVVTSDLVGQWLPGRKVFNAYGPTETTVCATLMDCATWNNPSASPPIGRPIDNVQVYVLDAQGAPVPIGVPGELSIGGIGVARGYLNRPDRTSDRFITHPAWGRLYKTGDMCRWLPDGTLAFLGRMDAQVKIRGFRIELGEIEAVLRQHPSVREVVVLVQEDRPGDQRLVAYLATPTTPLTTADLRAYLKQYLPDYMLPSAFVFLDALPLTPSGKVDRQALPAPDIAGTPSGQGFVAPRTPIEADMSRIWCDVLGLEQVSIDANFFELGGHSLLAVRLIGAINAHYGQNLPLSLLFAHPTVEVLAACLQNEASPDWWTPLVALQPRGDDLPFFCLPGLADSVFSLHSLACSLDPQRPCYGLQMIGLDGHTPPHTTVEAMASHYLAAIRQVQPHGPYYLGGYSWGGKVAFELAHQLRHAEESIGLVVLFDCLPPGRDEQADQPLDECSTIALFIKFLEEVHHWHSGLSAADLAALSADERLQRLRTCLEQTHRLAPRSDLAQVRGMLNVFQVAMQMDYNPPREAAGNSLPLLFLAPEEADAAAIAQKVAGWSACGTVTVQTVPGNHFSMLQSPHVAVAARIVSDYMQSNT